MISSGYEGMTYFFRANYAGGDGNDLVLTSVAVPCWRLRLWLGLGGVLRMPTVSGTTQTFQWDQVAIAASYLLEVKDVTAGAATQTYTVSGGSTTSCAKGLIAGHTYQWNVWRGWIRRRPAVENALLHDPRGAKPRSDHLGLRPPTTSATTVSMTATTATDPSGVQYYFRCLTPGGHSSAWQASPTYVDTGLMPGATYIYEVKTRDESPNYNQGNYSASASAATVSGVAKEAIANSVETGTILHDDALPTSSTSQKRPTPTTRPSCSCACPLGPGGFVHRGDGHPHRLGDASSRGGVVRGGRRDAADVHARFCGENGRRRGDRRSCRHAPQLRPCISHKQARLSRARRCQRDQ